MYGEQFPPVISQHNMTNATTHRLTVDEKRKLEKIFASDIATARNLYNEARSKGHAQLAEDIKAEPPQAVTTALNRYKSANKARNEAEETLKKLGFRIRSWGEDCHLVIDDYQSVPRLKEYDTETVAKRNEFSRIEREFMLKLYAGSVEASVLIEQLTAALAALTA